MIDLIPLVCWERSAHTDELIMRHLLGTIGWYWRVNHASFDGLV